MALEVVESVVESLPQPVTVLTPLEAMGHGGIPVQAITRFACYGEERQWALEHLEGAFRVFSREGCAEGIAGHVRVRDPGFRDLFWIV